MSEKFSLTDKQQAALAIAKPAAEAAHRETGFWSSFLIAEWVLASNWGKDQPGNNPFAVKYAPHVHHWGWQLIKSEQSILRDDWEEYQKAHPEAKKLDDRLNGAIIIAKAEVPFAVYPTLAEAFVDRARMYQFIAPYAFVWHAHKEDADPMPFVRIVYGADERGQHRAAKIERIMAALGLAGAEEEKQNGKTPQTI